MINCNLLSTHYITSVNVHFGQTMLYTQKLFLNHSSYNYGRQALPYLYCTSVSVSNFAFYSSALLFLLQPSRLFSFAVTFLLPQCRSLPPPICFLHFYSSFSLTCFSIPFSLPLFSRAIFLIFTSRFFLSPYLSWYFFFWFFVSFLLFSL